MKKSYLSNLLKNKDLEAELYVMGLFLMLFVVVLYGILLLTEGLTGLRLTGYCYFMRLTGIYCPGCGATRALFCLLRGKIAESMLANPIVFFSACVLLIFYLSQTLRFISRGRLRGLKYSNLYVIFGGGLLLMNWLVKNIFLLALNINLI